MGYKCGPWSLQNSPTAKSTGAGFSKTGLYKTHPLLLVQTLGPLNSIFRFVLDLASSQSESATLNTSLWWSFWEVSVTLDSCAVYTAWSPAPGIKSFPKSVLHNEESPDSQRRMWLTFVFSSCRSYIVRSWGLINSLNLEWTKTGPRLGWN